MVHNQGLESGFGNAWFVYAIIALFIVIGVATIINVVQRQQSNRWETAATTQKRHLWRFCVGGRRWNRTIDLSFRQVFSNIRSFWWATMESNHRPQLYQSCALTNWASRPFAHQKNNMNIENTLLRLVALRAFLNLVCRAAL